MFFRLVIILLAVLVTTSCGFKPMLAKQDSENIIIDGIKIGKVDADNPIKIERLLEEMLNIEKSSSANYILNVKLTSRTESQAIQKNSVTSRFRIRVDLKYDLQDVSTGNIINSGNMYQYGSYNVASSDFMNYMSDRYVNDNLLRSIITDLKSRLSLVLMAKDNSK